MITSSLWKNIVKAIEQHLLKYLGKKEKNNPVNLKFYTQHKCLSKNQRQNTLSDQS